MLLATTNMHNLFSVNIFIIFVVIDYLKSYEIFQFTLFAVVDKKKQMTSQKD